MTHSLFKKTVLAVSIVGLTTGAYANDENKSTTASTGSTILASAGTVVGTGCLVAGAIKTAGILFQPDICKMVPPSASNLIISDPHYAWLMVPGVLLIVGSTMYLARSAKTRLAKVRSILGSMATVAGGTALALGCAGTIVLLATRKPLEIMQNSVSAFSTVSKYFSYRKEHVEPPLDRSLETDMFWFEKHNPKLMINEGMQDYTASIAFLSVMAAAGGLVATLGTVLQP